MYLKQRVVTDTNLIIRRYDVTNQPPEMRRLLVVHVVVYDVLVQA